MDVAAEIAAEATAVEGGDEALRVVQVDAERGEKLCCKEVAALRAELEAQFEASISARTVPAMEFENEKKLPNADAARRFHDLTTRKETPSASNSAAEATTKDASGCSKFGDSAEAEDKLSNTTSLAIAAAVLALLLALLSHRLAMNTTQFESTIVHDRDTSHTDSLERDPVPSEDPPNAIEEVRRRRGHALRRPSPSRHSSRRVTSPRRLGQGDGWAEESGGVWRSVNIFLHALYYTCNTHADFNFRVFYQLSHVVLDCSTKEVQLHDMVDGHEYVKGGAGGHTLARFLHDIWKRDTEPRSEKLRRVFHVSLRSSMKTF